MITISITEYNEKKTRETLAKLAADINANINADIYELLGCETSDLTSYYAKDCLEELKKLSAFLIPQNGGKLEEAYAAGDYFHIKISKIKATRRVIINTKDQQTSLKIVNNILNNPVLKGSLVSMKFFAKAPGSPKVRLKYDKVVLYFHETGEPNIGKVFDIMNPGDTSGEISAFYDLWTQEENGKALNYIGTGIETDPKVSFTMQREQEILEFMPYFIKEKCTIDEFVNGCYGYVTKCIQEKTE